MQLYQTQEQSLVELTEDPFRLEREIQSLFENNLYSFTGLEFIKSEFTIKNNRIDTLAFDPESQAFVIIEYKRERNYSVIDQGVSYLNLMLDYKADFIVEYNESQSKQLKRQDVDWSQSRIIFVSPSFTDFQKQSTNFKDFSIELWEIKRYQGGIISVNPLQKTKSAPSIKQVQKMGSEDIKKIAKEIQTYDEAYHLADKSDDIKELYEQFRDSILNLAPDIEMNIRKNYIAFKCKNSNLLYVHFFKDFIRFDISEQRKKLIDDPRNFFKDVVDGNYCAVKVKDSENLEYILSLIKQTLK
jgi:predicted transport protein